MATQIDRIDALARRRGWTESGSIHGHRVLRRGQSQLVLSYGPSTGLVHDAAVKLLDDNGDAVHRRTIAHAADTDKAGKITEYLTCD